MECIEERTPMPVPTLQSVLLATAEMELIQRVEPVFVAAGTLVEMALTAETAQAAMSGVRSGTLPELALLDAALPGNLQDILAAARAEGQQFPIVLISDTVTQDWAAYLESGIIDDLIPRGSEPAYWQIRAGQALRSRRYLTALDEMRENEVRNAQVDRLTGVSNREALLSMLFRETDRVQRMKTAMSLVLFDLDDFGHWNTRLGMDVCDELLCQVVQRAGRLLRSYDVIGRTGKDEFLIALPGCAAANAITLAERLRLEVFSSPFRLGGESVRLSACFGIAQSHGRSPVVVLREAEQALEKAKAAGPESIQVFGAPASPAPTPVTFLSAASGDELLAW
jgi:two-component system, cell cycle response regulator